MNPLEQWAIRWGVQPAALAELASVFSTVTLSDGAGSETAVSNAVRIEAPKLGAIAWRNNSGAAIDDTGRAVRYGLANDSKKINAVFKSSDLIGITPVTWYGRRFGVFTAIETKRPGWTKPENDRDRAQQNFLMTVESMGGIAMFTTSVEDYRQRIAKC